jgi:hypothetical protein
MTDRRHEDNDSNLSQLLKLRSEDDPTLQTWLEKKRLKFTSWDVQNEVIKIMALQVSNNNCTRDSAGRIIMRGSHCGETNLKHDVSGCFSFVMGCCGVLRSLVFVFEPVQKWQHNNSKTNCFTLL